MLLLKMGKMNDNKILSFKDELHARPYIKLENSLRTFHFAYLIRENDVVLILVRFFSVILK